MSRSVQSTASWLIDQEARALLTRLDRVQPFALTETMVPAAALAPTAQASIDRTLIEGRAGLRRDLLAFLDWLGGAGRQQHPAEQHRRFVLLRMRFNDVLSQLDLFAEVVTQRSEHDTGVWLSGLDVLARDALELGAPYLDPPPVVCYLARGPGAAIRRAHTRLPGGAASPVAIVRVPRERMVGHGIASSLVHEVGHQGAALLSLVESLRPVLRRIGEAASPAEAGAWPIHERTVSEVVADLWSVATLGISSTLGLLAVVSMPCWVVFRPSRDDPHPMPYVRVLISCAIGRSLYPHPQWAALEDVWRTLYPLDALTPDRRRHIDALVATVPQFVGMLLDHRPDSLRGRSLREIMPIGQRRPDRLIELYEAWRRRPAAMAEVPPSLAFAVLGQARAGNRISPRGESRVVGNLLTYWAARSTLDTSAVCADVLRRRPLEHVS